MIYFMFLYIFIFYFLVYIIHLSIIHTTLYICIENYTTIITLLETEQSNFLGIKYTMCCCICSL